MQTSSILGHASGNIPRTLDNIWRSLTQNSRIPGAFEEDVMTEKAT
jgi:hypothetical protein